MKLAIACPTAPGHLNPSLALASELQSMGHEVCLACFRDGEAKAAAAGIRHCVVAEDEFPRGQMALELKEVGRHTGFKAMRATAEFLVRQHLADIRDLPRICETEKFDGMVIDQFSNGTATVAQALRIPHVTIANALWFTRDLSMPAGSSALPSGNGVFGGLKCRLSHLPMSLLTRTIFKAINQKRVPLGLDNLTYRNWAESDLAIVSQLPKSLEFPEMTSPDHLHYTGPFFRSETREVD